MQIKAILCTDSDLGVSKIINGKSTIPWDCLVDKQFFADIISSFEPKSEYNFICGKTTYDVIRDLKMFKGAQFSILGSFQLPDYVSYDIFTDSLDNALRQDKINIVLGGHRVYNELFENYPNVEIIINVLKDSYNCDGKLANANIFNSNLEDPYVIPRIVLPELTQYVTPGLYRNDEEQYIRLLEELINETELIKTRNGMVKKNNNTSLTFHMENGFPLLTTKKILFSSVFEELMFFIRGQTNSKILEEKGINIWRGNTTREFLDLRGLDYPEGEMGPMYGHQWRNFGGVDQIQNVIEILKTDPTSRRICLTSYNPIDLNKGVLEPCHGLSIIFNTKHVEGNTYKLNLMQTQRSADMFLGLPYNIASYALMLHLIADYVTKNSKFTYIPDTLYVVISDYHLYENHIAQAKRQCLRLPKKFPTLKILENNVKNIGDYELSNISLENYNPYGYIKADMLP